MIATRQNQILNVLKKSYVNNYYEKKNRTYATTWKRCVKERSISFTNLSFMIFMKTKDRYFVLNTLLTIIIIILIITTKSFVNKRKVEF